MSEITQLITQELNELNDYNVDQSAMCKRRFLKFLNQTYKRVNVPRFEKSTIPYMFDPYTEDVDVPNRYNKFIATTSLSLTWIPESKSNITIVTEQPQVARRDPYTDDDAEEKYLKSNPVSFIVIAKPNIGEAELAKIIVKHWQCVLITPESVLRDEIASDSRVGKCINFNLRNGHAIGPEVLLRLVHRRIQSQTARHRGFIIAGFPLIPNANYQDDPLSSESAIFNVEEIFEDIFLKSPLDFADTSSTMKGSKVSLEGDKYEDIEEEDVNDEQIEMRKVGFSLEKVKDVDLGSNRANIIKPTRSFTVLLNVEHQLEFLFKMLKRPVLYIYIFCSNLDVVNKVEKYRFNILSEKEVSLHKESADAAFSPDVQSATNAIDEDEPDVNMKSLVKLPIHFNASISAQLKVFKYELLPIIDSKVLQHDPQFFVKVDGRLSPSKIYFTLRLRLKTLGLQHVLIPEKLSETEEIEGEFPEEDEANAEDRTHEDMLNKYKRANIVGPMFKWQLSNWGYKCPVALKRGFVVNGSPDHVVRFMNKLFFLSDDAAVLSFCRNPRPYLIPTKPKPSHRIFIIGPKYSGRSAVSKCLSYLFDCTLLELNVLEEKYKKKKQLEYLEKVRTAAIAEGLIALEQLREHAKEEKIHFWMKNTFALLKSEFPDFKDISKTEKLDAVYQEDASPPDVSHVSSDRSVASCISERTHSEIMFELKKSNLPIKDKNKIKSFFEDRSKLLEYLPEDLQKPIKSPTVFDPFVTDYVNDVLEKTQLEDEALTTEDIVDMYKTAIKRLEEHDGEQRGSWVFDGFPPEMDILKDLPTDVIADEIICLIDVDPHNKFLRNKYLKNNATEFLGYRRFFEDLKRYSAADRVPLCMGSSYAIIARASKLYSTSDSGEASVSARSESEEEYMHHLNEFRKKWAKVKDYFLTVCTDPPIELNIANKKIPALLSECILQIENRYRRTASEVTDEERAQEAKDLGGRVEDPEEEEEEEELDEEEPQMYNLDENRRYGDTNYYCPIALLDHFVLWKGNENFLAQFESKIYSLSSKAALNDFIKNPRSYVMNLPVENIPPPRICIVGPIGSGKSTLARRLAHSFGLFYIDFEKLVLNAFDLDEKRRIDDLINKSKTAMNENAELHSEEIKILKKYLQGDALLPEYILENILNQIWFIDPYKTTGFILDNYPRKSADLEFMKTKYYIPDMVIELHANQAQVHSRIFQLKIDAWRQNMDERKRLKEIEDLNVLRDWEAERRERIHILVETLKEERKEEFIRSQAPVPPFSSPADSYTALPVREEEELNTFIYDPAQQQEDLEEVKLKVEQDLPKPEFDFTWESLEEVSEQIEALIEQSYVRDVSLLAGLIVEVRHANIECNSFETNQPVENVFNQMSIFLEKFKLRNRSLLERVYSVTIDEAEKLLEQGYYFFSKFGRTCPVQVYEKLTPIQMFLCMEHKMTIHPTIHRRYIYFICGTNHQEKFKRDPLLYVENEDFELPLFPLKIAIIGPPKSGKSFLADKFQKELGLRIITRGQACRYVLKNLSSCELAQNMNDVLRRGWSLTSEMVAAAIEAVTFDGKSIAQGFVLDGFPDSVDGFMHLRDLGILPYVFIDVDVEDDKMEECTLNDTGKKNMRPLSYAFIKYRYNNWLKDNILMKEWLEKEYQNIYKVPKPDSKWQVWDGAKNIVFSNAFNIFNYYKNRDHDDVFLLKSLLISPLEFEEKQSSFKNFCPCCLLYNNHLVTSGDVPDRNGLVQFRDYYYWICSRHLEQFRARPRLFLPPESEAMLPDSLPYSSECGCLHSYQSGICIVCYWDSRPKNVVKYGINRYTVFFKQACYLFCSEQCMSAFLREPHIYFDKISYFRDPCPMEFDKDLPTLGYLQQYVATLLIKAIVSTEILRPVHPCMDIQTSALMNIALYLKINNPKTNKDYLRFHEENKKKFDERREKVKELISMFTVTENPFLCFDASYFDKPYDPLSIE